MGKIQKTLAHLRYKYEFGTWRIRNKDVSIICNCCLGGMLYRDLNLRFMSPTIKLNIPFDDFLKFAANLEAYLPLPIEECEPLDEEFRKLGGNSRVNFPCGKCGDVRLLFQHYASFAEAKATWEKRRDRVRPENVVVVFLNWGEVTEERRAAFERIPYKKVMLTTDPGCADNKTIFYLDYPKDKTWFDVDESRSEYCTHHYYDAFPWISFFNRRRKR